MSGGDGSTFDLAVVGGGPGGYVAAIRASQLGMRTAVVEREHLGGVCLNWGCIPTKALLRTSEIHHLLNHLDEFGFSAGEIRFDIQALVKRSRTVAGRLQRGVRHLMKKNGIRVFEAQARLAGPGTLALTGTAGTGAVDPAELRAEHIVLATGARARCLPGLEPDGERIWTYKEAMIPSEVPESLLIVGSGSIGVEFASFYRDMGAEVTVVEVLPEILPNEDDEISTLARKLFEGQGIGIHTGASVKSLNAGNDGVEAVLELGDGATDTLKVDRVIVAVGIVGNTEDLGLEGTGVVVEGGHVVTDPWLATGEPGVYAIGDLAGPPWLAHKASHEGVLCVERIAGVEGVHPLDASRVPACTYCRPQIASVGLTERAASEAGYEVRVGRFPFQANGKAIALGERDGLVKTIFCAKTGELLGAHMLGNEVTELIQGFAIARALETTEQELMQTVFPHPTLSESMHEAVLDAFGRVIHA